MNGHPMNGREQFKAVRRLESFNQAIHPREALMLLRIV
jgi:hypothetical protein